VGATDDPQEVAGVGQALVLVKAWQTPRAGAQLVGCLAPDGVAPQLQNGLELAGTAGPRWATCAPPSV